VLHTYLHMCDTKDGQTRVNPHLRPCAGRSGRPIPTAMAPRAPGVRAELAGTAPMRRDGKRVACLVRVPGPVGVCRWRTPHSTSRSTAMQKSTWLSEQSVPSTFGQGLRDRVSEPLLCVEFVHADIGHLVIRHTGLHSAHRLV
jgi:hypothetical protein